ncbi:MAG: signal peptide peptidase SppA [Sphingomonadales bacterium]|nr:signal peptide peptidase SppA [Sphingomonadales bacterium]
MKFARFVWKTLVAIKDGLVLLLLLLFFWGLYAVLTMRPSAADVRNGALYLPIDGPIVEEKTQIDPWSLLTSRGDVSHEFAARDLVRAISAAASDDRIKAVVIDLSEFGGARQVSLEEVGAAMDKVRAAKKPVLVYDVLYQDGSALLGAHASEAWVDPMGGVEIAGPGGSQLYYKDLLDKLKVNAHVFRVGTYKSAVEPYFRNDASPAAKEELNATYGALWQDWQDDYRKARPRADIDTPVKHPLEWLAAAGGNAAKAAVGSGLVDRIGDRVAFGQRVAQIAGKDSGSGLGDFRATSLDDYLADKTLPTAGKAIAVVTVAGEIVDGEAGPGKAGGDRIAGLIDDANANGDYAALVVRVDSPGGSVMASEKIRAAIARMRNKGLPVVVSMGNLAASGGYWVTTPGQMVFAEPSTITGSIGVFGVVPTFEHALPQVGIHADPFRLTPLGGQPDLFGGLTPQASALIQGQIEQIYARFLGLVARARHKSPAEVDKIAQGRVWDGGTARQLGLVDRFGGLGDALAYAAQAAGIKDGKWHPVYLGSGEDTVQSLLERMTSSSSGDGQPAGDMVALAAQRQAGIAAQLGRDLSFLLSGTGAQAYCLECAGIGPAPRASVDAANRDKGWLALLATKLAL